MNSEETHRWTHVRPGDLVRSPGAMGRRWRDQDTDKVVTFGYRPLLVLARYFDAQKYGCETSLITFLCLSSSQGLVLVIQQNLGPR